MSSRHVRMDFSRIRRTFGPKKTKVPDSKSHGTHRLNSPPPSAVRCPAYRRTLTVWNGTDGQYRGPKELLNWRRARWRSFDAILRNRRASPFICVTVTPKCSSRIRSHCRTGVTWGTTISLRRTAASRFVLRSFKGHIHVRRPNAAESSAPSERH